MSKQSFISSYKYQLRRVILPPVIAISATVATMLLMAGIIGYSIDGKFTLEYAGAPCIDAMAGFMFFLYGIIFIPEFMNAGAANGVSRTTTLAASLASFFTSSAICSAVVSVISPLVSLICGDGGEMFLLELFYGEKRFYMFYGESALVVRIRFFVMCMFLFFMCAAAGILFSSIYYKLPRKGNIIFSIILMLICFFGYPFSKIILEKYSIDIDEILKEFFLAFGRLFGMAHVNGSMAGNCVQGVFMMFIFAAVCGVIAWLFVRRSGVKPAPIRGE
ncbi:MAG: hypothetical protein PUI48_00920 [Oscillospiraceae bacterium]|nr:hypothetical protein [Oscillospiraceae bacterium]MDY6208980.1 hypothetical protein [Oscillospiraceae bacterium]